MNTWASTGGSGVQYATPDGRYVDAYSDEGRAITEKNKKDYVTIKSNEATDQLGLEKTKALIALKDQTAETNTALSAARTQAARERSGGGGIRGMNRRTYRQKGGSAFNSIGLLANANAAAASKDVGGYFDQAAQVAKNKVKRDIGLVA